MANKLVLEDRRNDPWGKVEARIIWEGTSQQSSVWVNESGRAEFDGTGLINAVVVAGEAITPPPRKVNGSTTIIVTSDYYH